MRFKLFLIFIFVQIGVLHAQKKQKVFNNYYYAITPTNKIGLLYNNQLIIDTIYYAFFGLDTVNNRIWANRSIKKIDNDFENEFNEKVYHNQLEKKWELLDLSGNSINGTIVDYPVKFVQQKAVVSFDNKNCIIDTNGSKLTELNYDNIIRDSKDFFFLKNKKKWGVMNLHLQWINHPKFDDISQFIGEYCFAKIKDSLFIMDKNGETKDLNELLKVESIFNFLDTNALKKRYRVSSMEEFLTKFNQFNQIRSKDIRVKMENSSMIYYINNFFINQSLADVDDEESFPENILKSPTILENNWLNYGELGNIYHLELVFVSDSMLSYMTQTEKAVYSFGSLAWVNDNLIGNNFFVVENQLKTFTLSDVCIPNYKVILLKLYMDECENNTDVQKHQMDTKEMYKNISKNYVFSEDGLTFYYNKNYYPENSAKIEVNISPKELMMILKPNTILFNYYLKMMK